MSIPSIPDPALIVMSVLAQDPSIPTEIVTTLEERLGPSEQIIGPIPFNYTSYYDKEMGHGIMRWIWSFTEPVDRATLPNIKLYTNDVESANCIGANRTINLDPGLLSLENFVLATGKNRSHRIYLRDGIFADLTLTYEKGSYRPTPWTYPDYRDPAMINILNDIRNSYYNRMKINRNKVGLT